MAKSYYSTVLDHDAETVWAVVRDFNGLATWWSASVSESHIEDGKAGDQVGAIRSFKLGDATIRERLMALSDLDRSFSYAFEEPRPFPVDNYVATARVRPVADGRSFVEYYAEFDHADVDHWTAFFAAEVFAPALAALSEYLGR
ncbi:SRPBCC family protein [Cryptosporangium phraense]|uniref:SRPBCC family protein n=1 Tax=Cryptosporangium phraense TaxID=2593070 RepID=A0A545AI36_9ACTN|nr:SRPBCC family protein [Cryptosporangium phraense]TQS40981.1 SRPBCC family protein [Cryptosporangium phraense]